MHPCADCPGGPDQTARAEQAEAERDRLREMLTTVAVRLENLPNGHGHLISYTGGIARLAREALTSNEAPRTEEER